MVTAQLTDGEMTGLGEAKSLLKLRVDKTG